MCFSASQKFYYLLSNVHCEVKVSNWFDVSWLNKGL